MLSIVEEDFMNSFKELSKYVEVIDKNLIEYYYKLQSIKIA